MSITEFLEARIAEDEAHANGWCEDDAPCYVDNPGHKAPARVLAECAAKRAIVGSRDAIPSNSPRWSSMDRDALGAYGEWEDTLSTLAAVYKDHPDYRQEWAL